MQLISFPQKAGIEAEAHRALNDALLFQKGCDIASRRILFDPDLRLSAARPVVCRIEIPAAQEGDGQPRRHTERNAHTSLLCFLSRKLCVVVFHTAPLSETDVSIFYSTHYIICKYIIVRGTMK